MGLYYDEEARKEKEKQVKICKLNGKIERLIRMRNVIRAKLKQIPSNSSN
jgi:hypothetical protein